MINNKGFAATTIVYTIFLSFIAISMLLIYLISTSLSSNIYSSKNVKERINEIVPYNVCGTSADNLCE